MTFTPTAILAAVACAIAIACGWRGARPASPLAAPRLVPWRLMMLLAFAVMVAALGHLVALVRSS